ncbi:MAG TPA: hypothetical protein VFE51_17530 [Verrucomicrobiae bacterium]|nr:hypothetical protein [Verrucomicrobiae bacterium]
MNEETSDLVSAQINQLRVVRLDEFDPTGKQVNAALVSNMKMWVRCMWPDLRAMKRETSPPYKMRLGKFEITPPFKVYELRGKSIGNKKIYEDAQEVFIDACEATDVTEEAQLALNSAEAYYERNKAWPVNDNF